MISIYPMPMSTTMKNSITDIKDFYRNKCKTCDGTGYEGTFTNEFGLQSKITCGDCGKKIEYLTTFILSGVPKTYVHIDSVSKKLYDEDKKFMKDLIADIKDAPEQMRFICLASTSKGVGKTGTMVYVVKEHYKALKQIYPDMELSPITWITASFLVKNLYKDIEKNKMKAEEKEAYKAFMDSVMMNPILVIDGLGDHFIKPGVKGDEQYITNRMEEVFRYRQEQGLSIYCTSNYPLFHFNEQGYAEGGGGIGANDGTPTILDKYGERFCGLWQRHDCVWYKWETMNPIRAIESASKSRISKYRKI